MDSTPRTPTQRRGSAVIDLSFTSASPQRTDLSSRISSHGRTTSSYSIASPAASSHASPLDRRGSFGAADRFNGSIDPENGLGNLADELAEAWEEEGDGEQENGSQLNRKDHLHIEGSPREKDQFGLDSSLHTSSATQLPSRPSLSPPKQSARLKHRRKPSRYDDSDAGNDSNPEGTEGISPSLEARMATIEILARQGTESNRSDMDTIVPRVADSLKDLGSQASLENSATR